MGDGQSELQVTAVSTNDAGEAPDIRTFLNAEPVCVPSDDFASEQRKDPDLREIVDFLEKEELPCEEKRARRIALQASLFTNEGRLLSNLCEWILPKALLTKLLRRRTASVRPSTAGFGPVSAEPPYVTVLSRLNRNVNHTVTPLVYN